MRNLLSIPQFKNTLVMKFYLFLFFSLLLSSYSYAQNTAAGFYVTTTNDTIPTQIKIPTSLFGSVDLSKFIFKVETIDSSSNESKKFKPGEIKSFEFVHKQITYTFYSQPTITNKNMRFLQALYLSPATNIYLFKTADQNGKAVGVFYTLERADGIYAFLSTGIRNLDKFKETLKEFYKDKAALQAIIDTKFTSRMAIERDIITIAKTANIL
jgi:hypothetical protein